MHSLPTRRAPAIMHPAIIKAAAGSARSHPVTLVNASAPRTAAFSAGVHEIVRTICTNGRRARTPHNPGLHSCEQARRCKTADRDQDAQSERRERLRMDQAPKR